MAAPIAVLVGIVFLLRAGFMQVGSFQIEGTETISQNEVQNAAHGFASGTDFFVIPKTNILLLSKSQLASALAADFSKIEKVDIGKNFFERQVEIYVTERQAAYLWCKPAEETASSSTNCYLMTAGGYIFAPEDGENLLKFGGLINGDPLKQNFATAQKMKNYSDFVAALKNGGVDVFFIYMESADKATAMTNAGNIIFNPEDGNLNQTAENSILLINNIKSKNPAAAFQYLDARFGNKIFYKLK